MQQIATYIIHNLSRLSREDCYSIVQNYFGNCKDFICQRVRKIYES